MNSMIKDSEKLRKNTESNQGIFEKLKRERYMITKTVMRAKENVRSQEDTSITMDNNKKKLENESKSIQKT